MNSKNTENNATLRQWQLFILAIEKGSILGAAAAAGTDPAVVSKEITKLEHLLGEPLLDRSRSGVRPTWLGAQKYEKLQSLNHTPIEINSYQNLDDIQPENFDLIICTQTLPNVRMIAYDIASISYGIFASPDFLAQNKRITVPAQLEKLPLIHSKSEKVLLQGPLQSITITVEPQIRINSDEAMISAAVEALGIALRIPLWAAESLTKSGSLIQILGE